MLVKRSDLFGAILYAKDQYHFDMLENLNNIMLMIIEKEGQIDKFIEHITIEDDEICTYLKKYFKLKDEYLENNYYNKPNNVKEKYYPIYLNNIFYLLLCSKGYYWIFFSCYFRWN